MIVIEQKHNSLVCTKIIGTGGDSLRVQILSAVYGLDNLLQSVAEPQHVFAINFRLHQTRMNWEAEVKLSNTQTSKGLYNEEFTLLLKNLLLKKACKRVAQKNTFYYVDPIAARLTACKMQAVQVFDSGSISYARVGESQ